MTTLFRATDSRYAARGASVGFQWWTPSREWAEGYGSTIVERSGDDLELLDLPLDGLRVQRALERAGIDCDDIAFVDETGYGEELEMEAHQILTGPMASELAERLRAAGYDGVTHPDNVDGRGVGEAVALIV